MISENDFLPTSRLIRVTATIANQLELHWCERRLTDLYQDTEQREDKELRKKQESAVSTGDDSIDLRVRSRSLVARDPTGEGTNERAFHVEERSDSPHENRKTELEENREKRRCNTSKGGEQEWLSARPRIQESDVGRPARRESARVHEIEKDRTNRDAKLAMSATTSSGIVYRTRKIPEKMVPMIFDRVRAPSVMARFSHRMSVGAGARANLLPCLRFPSSVRPTM